MTLVTDGAALAVGVGGTVVLAGRGASAATLGAGGLTYALGPLTDPKHGFVGFRS